MNKIVRLTKTCVEQLPSPSSSGRDVWRDALVSGLQLIVTGTGRKSFYVRRKIRGRSERFFIGAFPEITVETARRRAQEIIGKVAAGQGGDAIREPRAKDVSLDGLFTRYLHDFAKPHKRTWQQDEAQYNRYLTPWKCRRANSITRAEILKLHATIGECNGHYAANRVLALLSKVYNFASDMKLQAGENPAARIRKFRESPRKRYLKADELPRFFAALDGESNDVVRDFVWMALLTGQRRSNVLAMTWDQIELAAGIWTIPMTKNGSSHTVPLPEKALAILDSRARFREGEFVFPGVGRTGHLTEPKTAWRRLLTRAGISNLRIHDLRHTLASWQAGTGASLLVIGQTLNHKTAAATHRYAHLSSDTVRTAMSLAVNAMLAAGQATIEGGTADDRRGTSSSMGQGLV